MPRKVKTIQEMMWAMPTDERCAMLVCSIIDKDRSPLGAVKGMIEVTSRMAAYLNGGDRYRIAEAMRDVADRLEQSEPVLPA